jgi:hypothetical protein
MKCELVAVCTEDWCSEIGSTRQEAVQTATSSRADQRPLVGARLRFGAEPALPPLEASDSQCQAVSGAKFPDKP